MHRIFICSLLILFVLALANIFSITLVSHPVAAKPYSSTQLTFIPLQNIKQITTGANHTCALTNSGGVKCWGYNWAGQLGNNNTVDSRVPVAVSGLSQEASMVSAGGGHTCALMIADGIKCWGANGNGILGNGLERNSTTPVNATAFPTTTVSVTAGSSQTCIVTNAGKGSCIGYYATATDSNLIGGVSQIAAGSYYACALLDTGGVQCWGFNQYGELGYGLSMNSSVPVDVNGLDGSVQAITTGSHHACALLNTGSVKCWGWNNTGQLGDGSITNRYSPVDVIGLSNVSAVSAGKMHTCALLKEGGVSCWGENAAGQLGDGTTTRRETPAPVAGLNSGVIAIDTGDDHTCVLLNNSHVKCWGSNAMGQVGQNEAFYTTPVDVMTPLIVSDHWQPMSTMNAPIGRGAHTIVWSGSEVLIWGGETTTNGFDTTNTGGRYNPLTDSWSTITTVNAPAARRFHSAVWTGTEMLIWGGEAGNSGPTFNNGGRYDPKTDTWSPISTVNAPTGRLLHSAIWTGTEMIIWGGDLVSPNVTNTKSGGRYNPSTDTWTPLTEIGAPTARNQHNAIWTGNEMIIWGGIDNCCATNANVPSGGRFNPQINAWSPLAASNPSLGFYGNLLVWTGTEMLVWGGHTRFNAQSFIGQRYNPATDAWTTMNTLHGPSARRIGSHIWTGDTMLAWGGYDETWLNTGGGYNPTTDSWFTIPITDAPPTRSGPAIWSGTEMIIWGGFFEDGNTSYFYNSGARYTPPDKLFSATVTPTSTPLAIPTDALTSTSTVTPNPRPTLTATQTPTPTYTPTPTPTDTPEPTATATSTVEPTSTATPSSTPTVQPPQSNGSMLYMPLVQRPLPTNTPMAQPSWQRIGQTKLNLRTVALHNGQLFIGERKQDGVSLGGLYQRPLNNCETTPDFTRLATIQNSSVLGLAFQNSQAVAATYDTNLFYSNNNGIDWQQSNTAVPRPRSVVIAGGNVFYAGTEDSGIYESTTGGTTWQQLDANPPTINRVSINTNTLWIGSEKGVFKRTLGGLTPLTDGLSNTTSKKVWDFAFQSVNEIYIATFDGVYKGDGINAWQPIGLQGKNLYSIELYNDFLYAGAHQGGVWQRPLSGGNWSEVVSPHWGSAYSVHDLFFDPSSCNGLLAATEDGLWLYR